MLVALVEEFLRLRETSFYQDLEIVTLWNPAIGSAPFAKHQSVQVLDAVEEEAKRETLALILKDCEAAIVVAPEVNQQLQDLCQLIHDSGCISLNADVEAVALCADKLELSLHLQCQNVKTIPTYPTLSAAIEAHPECDRFVRKPRFGVGSMEIQLLSSSMIDHHLVDTTEMISQPYLPGISCSIGCFRSRRTGQLMMLPVARQHLSQDGHFRYEGGESPVVVPLLNRVHTMAKQVVEAVPGLYGYFGIDFLIDEDGCPVLVEVNPRLTTSFVGYRKMTSTPLAQFFFETPPSGGANWQAHATFLPDGQVKVRTLREQERECCWH